MNSSSTPQADPSSMIANGVRSIAITATDRVTHEAEIATIRIGFELSGTDHASAYASAAKASNDITLALLSAGVPPENIESVQQSIAPLKALQLNQVPASDRGRHSFVALQSWNVRTTAEAAARTLDIAVKAGANNSGNITWSLRDPNAAFAEAAGKALQRARSQADFMANGLGVQIGHVLHASNVVQAAPVRQIPGGDFQIFQASAPPPLAINARQIETSATVYAVFAIE